MDQIKLKLPPGHVKSPLLQMIPLSHYVPNELHIMLRIWDRLWDLVLQELKTQNQFNDLARAKILAKMRRILISFNFWQEQGTQNWSYTSLMGEDKEKMGLYRPKDVTPYMHVLVHHLPEFMEQHQKFGLSAFSCAFVEKKNHDQVSAFF
ncbi:hypothetical protein GLOIN_2v1799695 [Rhizophagus irregularis DAOM 181602=DAOM 197198]|nr:hypothetical protein GLOIN_2v1799695 [Rhizophagus irregularis DAOM 181602=DAOM 197198]